MISPATKVFGLAVLLKVKPWTSCRLIELIFELMSSISLDPSNTYVADASFVFVVIVFSFCIFLASKYLPACSYNMNKPIIMFETIVKM